jgi:hypothetical protein
MIKKVLIGLMAQPAIPASGRLRQDDSEFKASLGYREIE